MTVRVRPSLLGRYVGVIAGSCALALFGILVGVLLSRRELRMRVAVAKQAETNRAHGLVLGWVSLGASTLPLCRLPLLFDGFT